MGMDVGGLVSVVEQAEMKNAANISKNNTRFMVSSFCGIVIEVIFLTIGDGQILPCYRENFLVLDVGDCQNLNLYRF